MIAQKNNTDIFKVIPVTVKYSQHLLNVIDEIAESEFKNRSQLLRELAAEFVSFKKRSLQR